MKSLNTKWHGWHTFSKQSKKLFISLSKCVKWHHHSTILIKEYSSRILEGHNKERSDKNYVKAKIITLKTDPA